MPYKVKKFRQLEPDKDYSQEIEEWLECLDTLYAITPVKLEKDSVYLIAEIG